ncbi:MAG: glycosyltransferase [bacterium]
MNALFIKFDGRAGPYVMLDLQAFFSALGHNTTVADLRNLSHLPKNEASMIMIQTIKEALRNNLPDLIIAYGCNNIISFQIETGAPVDLFTYLDIPSVSIFYDSPLDNRIFDGAFEAWHPENNYFFIWDHHFTDEMKKIGIKKSYYMPIGTNIRRFKKLPYNEEDAKKYGADVSFVGSYTTKREFMLRKLLDCKFNLVVWGYDWENAHDTRFRDCIRGVADNESDLAKVYNYSKVNINLTVDQGISSLNMRVFDCMACGGFLISDYKKDFDTLFDREKETVTFKTIDELPDLVGYYLTHEEERKEKAKLGRQRVLADHTYKNRVEFILETLENDGAFDAPRWWEKHGDPGKVIDRFLGLAGDVCEDECEPEKKTSETAEYKTVNSVSVEETVK